MHDIGVHLDCEGPDRASSLNANTTLSIDSNVATMTTFGSWVTLK